MSNPQTMEPGESEDKENQGPMNHVVNKRELRTLNERLELYVRNQQEKTRMASALKKELALQEKEHRERVRQLVERHESVEQSLRNQNAALETQQQQLYQEIANMKQKQENLVRGIKDRDARVATLESEDVSNRREIQQLKDQIDELQKRLADISYDFNNFDNEKKGLQTQIADLTMRNNLLIEEVATAKARYQAAEDKVESLMAEKEDEVNKLSNKLNSLQVDRDSQSQRLRQEFDQKLTDYISKREEQYKEEKNEWMRIFKEEFNRKLRAYKESNYDLEHSNQKLNNELTDVKSRNAKLRTQKTELESQNRQLEEEMEKIRKDLDDLKTSKDEDLRIRNQVVAELREKYKQKEIKYDELLGMKIQLSNEIDMYRKILAEAEKDAGYDSPLSSQRKKKRKLNSGEARFSFGTTPGLYRAVKDVQRTLPTLNDDMKDPSDGGNYNSNQENEINDDMDDNSDCAGVMNSLSMHEITPGGEAYPLQFSNMDLSQNMIEIQNVSDKNEELRGYRITNGQCDRMFSLPQKILKPNETVKIVIGKNIKVKHGEILWPENVWSGEQTDAARLYDNMGTEIARIEITPEMLPEQTRSGCLVM